MLEKSETSIKMKVSGLSDASTSRSSTSLVNRGPNLGLLEESEANIKATVGYGSRQEFQEHNVGGQGEKDGWSSCRG